MSRAAATPAASVAPGAAETVLEPPRGARPHAAMEREDDEIENEREHRRVTMPDPNAPGPVDRAQWQRPWVQLKFFTFQPQIYPKMIREASPDAQAGDWVNIYDKLGRRLGAGFWNRKANVPLRVLKFSSEPVEESYLEEAVRRAVQLRRDLFRLGEVTEAYRVLNSDGDGLSGLTIDRYGDVLFVDVYSLGMFLRLPRLLEVLHAELGTKRHRVRVDEDVAQWEGIKRSMLLPYEAKDAPRKIKIREHGVTFEVDFAEGHKTGFFCDQRENRKLLTRFTQGARVLDLCSYTGGFSIYAKTLGGAEDVTAVDLDEKAIEQGKRNANLNQARIKWVHADAFAYARQMQKNGEQWDVVVLDPPKFVLSRELEHDDGPLAGRRRYEDINHLALSLVKPGGVFVTCSCSGLVSLEYFEEYVTKAAHRQNRRLQFFERTGPGADHPVFSNCPESRYLKLLWARVF